MNKSPLQTTFGSDPEFMVLDTKTGKMVSAIELLKQGKENKVQLGKGYECFYDNVLFEMNIVPSDSKEGVVSAFRDGFKRAANKLGKRYQLVPQASHRYDSKECQHEAAKLFGCDPEFCAYNVEMCFPPDCTDTFRSAGGHIHIGRKDWGNFHMKDTEGNLIMEENQYIPNEQAEGTVLIDGMSKIDIIKLMDIYVGCALILIDQDPTSHARKKLYGKAGRHRPTHYGVEYRTPGNFWLLSPKTVELIYDLTQYVVKLAEEEKAEEILSKFDADDVRKAIDDNNKDIAHSIMLDAPMPEDLRNRIHELSKPQSFKFYSEWGIE